MIIIRLFDAYGSRTQVKHASQHTSHRSRSITGSLSLEVGTIYKRPERPRAALVGILLIRQRFPKNINSKLVANRPIIGMQYD